MNESEELQALPMMRRTVPIELKAIDRKITPAVTRSEADENPKEEATETPAQEASEADEDRFEIAISSEADVPRWYGTEILDHSSGSVDLSRAENGLAFLVDHDTGDQVGLVESIALGADRKLRGDLQVWLDRGDRVRCGNRWRRLLHRP